ncbi:serotransferrin-A-like [Rhopilema esculentum]|uniref:serotransferrin-A-like n=1 Tax=Rhopilema esculentum TaxID=499914 RepID=UPI0031D904BE
MELFKITIVTIAAFIGFSSGAAIRKPVWCVEGVEAFHQCKEINKENERPLRCLLGNDEKDCYEKISKGLADFSAFDGGSIYHAGKEFGLKVFMSEKLTKLADTGTKYYGIAVVKKSSNLTFSKLKGAKSCHTGIWRTAGWVIPVGTLLSSGQMPCLDGDLTKSVAAYFSGSCAAGAQLPKYNPTLSGAEKLCSVCSGEGDAKCSRTSKEPYYGYHGAFKCMKDGAGDVAFIKESILMKLKPEEQAKYKLLCPNDDTVKDPKDFRQCHMAGSPAHGLLTRKDATEDEIASYQRMLHQLVTKFGHEAKLRKQINVFDGRLFSRYAIGLDDVPFDKRSFEGYLGSGYINAISKLEHCS